MPDTHLVRILQQQPIQHRIHGYKQHLATVQQFISQHGNNMDALIIRKSCLGDVICAEPFIRALKGYEKISIEADVYAQVFHNHPLLVPQSDLKHPFQTFDLTNVYENKLHIPVCKAYLQEFGLSTEESEPKIYLTDEEKLWGRSQLGEGKWAVLDMGYPEGALSRGFWEFQDWRPVVDFVKSQGFKVVYIGGGAHAGARGLDITVESGVIDLDLRGKTDLRQLFSVIYNSSLFFGIDSGPMHVVQSFNIPGVAIFTPFHASDVVLNVPSSIVPLHAQAGDPMPAEEMITELRRLLDKP